VKKRRAPADAVADIVFDLFDGAWLAHGLKILSLDDRARASLRARSLRVARVSL
jgi:hypothetical protein